MNALIVIWGYTLCVISVVSGLMIIQHAICNLSRWTYSIRSVALWWNAMLLGGGIHVVTAYTIGGKTPIFGEVMIYAGIALMGIRGIRMAYWEMANDQDGMWRHLIAAVRITMMRVKDIFARGGR